MIKLVHLRIHPPIACPSASHVDRVGALSLSLSFSSRSFTHFCVVARSLARSPTHLIAQSANRWKENRRFWQSSKWPHLSNAAGNTASSGTARVFNIIMPYSSHEDEVNLALHRRQMLWKWACWFTLMFCDEKSAESVEWCKATITTWLFFKDFAVSSKCTNFLTTNEKGLKWD